LDVRAIFTHVGFGRLTRSEPTWARKMANTAIDGLRLLSHHLSKHWADPFAAKSNWTSNKAKATILGSLPKVITIRNGEYSSRLLDETRPPSSGPGDKDELRNGDLPVNGPSLELVVVPRDENDRVNLSSKCHNFAKIIAASNIDPVIHQHIYLCSYGFYHYDSDGLVEATGQPRSFYFGCFLYSIAWSFNPATMKTTGIIILRTVKRHNYGALPLEMLEGVLKVYSKFLTSPLFLAFASFIMLAHVLDDNVYRNVDLLRHVERDTEHGPGREGPRMFYKQPDNLSDVSIGDGDEMPGVERQDTVILEDKTDNINKLTEVSQQLADINVHLANLQRHVKFLMTMAETLEDVSFREYQFDGIPSGLLDSARASTEELLRPLPSLKRRILAVEPSIEYLQDRAKSLSQVVRFFFSLSFIINRLSHTYKRSRKKPNTGFWSLDARRCRSQHQRRRAREEG